MQVLVSTTIGKYNYTLAFYVYMNKYNIGYMYQAHMLFSTLIIYQHQCTVLS